MKYNIFICRHIITTITNTQRHTHTHAHTHTYKGHGIQTDMGQMIWANNEFYKTNKKAILDGKKEVYSDGHILSLDSLLLHLFSSSINRLSGLQLVCGDALAFDSFVETF